MMFIIVYKFVVFNGGVDKESSFVAAGKPVKSYHFWQVKLVAEIPIVVKRGLPENTGYNQKCGDSMIVGARLALTC